MWRRQTNVTLIFLFRDFYNKNVRPVGAINLFHLNVPNGQVKNSTQPLEVKFGASLIRIIDVVSSSLLSSTVPIITSDRVSPYLGLESL